jgi:hypothetical protein
MRPSTSAGSKTPAASERLPRLGAGLLKAAQGLADGVEHEEEQPGHVLVHEEGAVMGAVAPAPGVVEAFQKSGDLLEVLESRELFFLDFVSFFVGHACYQSILLSLAQGAKWVICKIFLTAKANGVPNRIGTPDHILCFRHQLWPGEAAGCDYLRGLPSHRPAINA